MRPSVRGPRPSGARALSRAAAFFAAALLAAALFPTPATPDPVPEPSRANHHADPVTGVRRIATAPVGDCAQCHVPHDAEIGMVNPTELFMENTNQLCYTTQSLGGCHADLPLGYPAREADRMPEGAPYPGYFEANAAGQRLAGLEYRVRWPGAATFENAAIAPGGRYFSPHASDPDMPRLDATGRGSCHSCHDPHGTPNPFDQLTATYLNGGGAASSGPPANFQLCFECHSTWGPSGMDPENRLIADYYDPGRNPEGTAGHQIRRDPDIALYWPVSVRTGDMLSCSDCHNPHGSRGQDGVTPNAFLLSDERKGWSGITDPINDPEQSRRFCLGCHIPSDGVPGSEVVRGIIMNTLPDEDAHRSTSTESCHKCHGGDYTSPQSYNVHHPSPAGL